jgi:hypothetical protein
VIPNDGRLRRLESSGEASQLRYFSAFPRMTKVPPVTGVKVLVTSVAGGRNEVMVAWVAPMDLDVKGYEVWMKHNGGTTRESYVTDSPAIIVVTVGTTGAGIFYISTVMNNGTTLDLDLCPSATATLTA